MYGDGSYWRDRAEEAHTRADCMVTSECRRAMLVIAESYHQMAERADQRKAQEEKLKEMYKRHKERFGT